MRTGRYSIGELFGNRHISQLIIPEIQRDYVWGSGQVKALMESILANFEKWRVERSKPPWKVVPSAGTADALPPTLQEDFAKFYSQRTRATNVGFVYAYCDADLPGQYFLIDGQQRLTTLFLMLLALANRVPELKDRFGSRYCLQPAGLEQRAAVVPTKLDYKVREHTAEFLRQFSRYFLNGGEVARLKDQHWFLERLNNDRTVGNLAGNFATIQELLESFLSKADPSLLYEYVEDFVECWYFDTNESAQGEELYLYLNARGESIAKNENLKARLLSKLENINEKDEWGRKWEDWQDFFWTRRPFGLKKGEDNPNADRGFNSFLSSIENLEKLRNKGGVSSAIDLQTIEKYIKALRWLEEEKDPFKNLYSYSGWVELWFSEVWGIFNQPDATEWAASLSDNKKSTAHNRMVLVWGSLLSIICAAEDKSWNWPELVQRNT
ncbi:MAG: DUF262 domain-containing protein [Terrimicrobiaceae bacterium]